MAQTRSIGRVLPIDRGTYAPDTDYDVMDYLRYLNGTYICKKPCRNVLPNTETGENEYWKIIAWDGSGGDTIATRNSLGGIIVGDGLDIDASGRLSAIARELQPATETTLGGIRVGNNLEIDENGILSSKDTKYDNVTRDISGLMSPEDKAKLDGIANGATANIGTITGVGAGTALSGGGSSGYVSIGHQSVANNTGYYGNGSTSVLSPSSSVTIPYIYVNSQGHVERAYNYTRTMPSTYPPPNSDRSTTGGLRYVRYPLDTTKTISISAHASKTFYFLDSSSTATIDEQSPYYFVQTYGYLKTLVAWIYQPVPDYDGIEAHYYYTSASSGKSITLFNSDSASQSISGVFGYMTLLFL